jgi:signal transduction histidine kinase
VDLKILAHDMRNALGSLAIQIEILRVHGADPESLDIMERQITKLQEIVNRMVPGTAKDE